MGKKDRDDKRKRDNNEEDEDENVVLIKDVSLGAIEDKIAQLEKELNEMSDDSIDEEDGDDEDDIDTDERSMKRRKVVSASTGIGYKVSCELCNVYVIGEDKLAEHLNGRKHGEKLREKLKTTYEPAGHQALYCRYCYLTFANEEEMLNHRRGSSHKAAVKEHDRVTYCSLCDKQFTSIIQLEEHERGKWHTMRLNKKAAASAKKWKK